MSSAFNLNVVRFLFRSALRQELEAIGQIENVLVEQNSSFQPNLTQIHVTEIVTTLSEKLEIGGMVNVVGRACYELNVPSGVSADEGEELCRKLIAALPVGDYLRDNAPGTGTNCSVYVSSAEPVGQRKHTTLPGWYVLPVEIYWRSFYFR